MIEKKYENVNPCKLQDELIAAGLQAGSFTTFDLGNDTAQIQFPDDISIDMWDIVAKVVAYHDKTPIPSPKSELEIAQDTITILRDQLAHQSTDFQAFMDYVFTNVQGLS